MVFEELLSLIGREPVFESAALLAGDVKPAYLRRQLSAWVAAGKLWQLRRGLYALAPPYQRVQPHPFLVANRLMPGSYVSLQAALADVDLIPEHVAAVTSVSPRRPGAWSTPLGEFLYRHVRPDLLFGYELRPVGEGQAALVAKPEKALLDLIYLQPEADVAGYIASLRLQNLDRLDFGTLEALAGRFGKPKMRRAAKAVALEAERAGFFEPL